MTFIPLKQLTIKISFLCVLVKAISYQKLKRRFSRHYGNITCPKMVAKSCILGPI